MINEYFLGKKQSKYYKKDSKAVTNYEELEIHFEGEFPKKLIEQRRPNESDAILEHRKKNYRSVTMPYMGKLVNNLSKIYRSPEWSVKFENENPRIRQGETLAEYTTYEYPVFGSVETWCKQVLTKTYLMAANAIEVVLYDSVESETEYVKPYALIFEPDHVLEYNKDMAILKFEDKHIYVSEGAQKEGDKFLVVDKTLFQWWGREGDNFVLINEIRHNLNYLPARQLGGEVYEQYSDFVVFQSRITAILPAFQSAETENSDHIANKIQHIYHERWEFDSGSCQVCYDSNTKRSTGFVKVKSNTKNERYELCHACGGTGSGNKNGPYSSFIVRQANTSMGEQPAPIPPAGYIQKDTGIVEYLGNEIVKYIYSGLSAVNMEYLATVQLSQSGVAKEVDRDDFNTFVYAIAEDLVDILDWTYKMIAFQRYGVVLNYDKEAIKAICPKINVPTNYDLLRANAIVDEIKQATEAGINSVITQQLQREYTGAKFYNNPTILKNVQAVFDLDPLVGKTQDQKIALKGSFGCTEEQYIISSNIEAFVTRAASEVKDFYEQDRKTQYKQLQKYAQEILKANGMGETDESGNPVFDSVANLKGSVGGLTGMIEIVKAVSSGMYDLEAAIALAMDRFGLTYEQAKAQIGTPTVITDPTKVENVAKLT